MSESSPLIAIAMDVTEPRPGRPRVECALAYAERVVAAGGRPVFVPPILDLIASQLTTFDGFILTGGDDPRTERFGEPTDPRTTPVHPRRQQYEERLIAALLAQPDVPVLGICLGMQMLALMCGGKLNQYLPDRLVTSEDHRDGKIHPVNPLGDHWLRGGSATSSHKQAVADAGRARVVATSHDGVIEAIDLPESRFCLGVQWHPERTEDANLGDAVFMRFIRAAHTWRSDRIMRTGGGGGSGGMSAGEPTPPPRR